MESKSTQKMIPRQLSKELKILLNEYPVVSLLGPRQAGKTTLARTLKNYHYCNLEHPETRSLAQEDPKAFFRQHPCPVVIDEIQRVPDLLSYIQTLVDEKADTGQFIITGSHQPQLVDAMAQSLAGRVGILKLLPLSVAELQAAGVEFKDFYSYAYMGFLPRVYDTTSRTLHDVVCADTGFLPREQVQALRPSQAYSNYYQTYVERDIRQLVNIKDYTLFYKFIRLLAGRVGQVMNYQSLANETGMSDKTIKQWLSVLEASFIVYKLCPYFNNFNKRLVKSPKYYFIEPGLLTYLLGIHKISQLERDPLVGSVFENLVVVECLKTQLNAGLQPNMYFFRDTNDLEVDLLCPSGSRLHALEMKSAFTYSPFLSKKLEKIKALHPQIKSAHIVYNGDTLQLSDNTGCVNFKNIGPRLGPLLT